MRKGSLILAAVLAASVLLSGCSIVKESVMKRTPDLNKAYSCNFSFSRSYEASAKPLAAAGTMTRYGAGIWEMEMTSPETLSGMKLTYNENGCTAQLGELSFETPTEKINSGAIFDMIFKAADNYAAQTSAELAETERGVEYRGAAGNFSYTMIFDNDVMTLKAIEFPECEMTVEISNMADL